MTTPTIVTGDDLILSVSLAKNGASFIINNMATVQARLVSSNHLTPLTEAIMQSHLMVGADWTQAIVVVVMAPKDTQEIKQQGPACLEIQVDDGSKLTWFVDVNLIKGSIA